MMLDAKLPSGVACAPSLIPLESPLQQFQRQMVYKLVKEKSILGAEHASMAKMSISEAH
jgi:hypothetical protein